mgnify:CR=1 FL=1
MMKKPNLNISIVQSDLIWHDKSSNLHKMDSFIQKIEDDTDLVILPEMFSSGFTMDSAGMAESMRGDTVKWMIEKAVENKCAISGSLVITDSDRFYNRHLFIHPDGSIDFYDKKHLFRMADEHKYYSPGNQRVVVKYKGWRIMLLTCYDLRFPVWSRSRNDYDVLIYVANWPEKRRQAWITLLAARAIENQAYVIGVNRVGMDGNQINYSGDSAVIDPKGDFISNIRPYVEGIDNINLDLESLQEFRKSFPVRLDADEFEVL